MARTLKSDVAVIGAGVLGVTIAYWLSELYECSVAVLDKDMALAQHTTLRNTGIAHRPFYLNPRKKKLFARSAEMSHSLWKKLADRCGLPWFENGTLMVATEGSQVKRLEEFMEWGLQNGMDGREYELLDPRQASKEEPCVRCESAILSKRDASTDFASLTRAVWEKASQNGAEFLSEAEVEGAVTAGGDVSVSLKDGRSLTCSLLINTAGGRSLDIAHMMGLAEEFTDLHFRGEYWEVDPARAPRVGKSVYSVARHKGYPFLDPHFVLRADGRREVGPNAVLVAGPETYRGVGGALGIASKMAERPLGPKARLFSNGEFLSLIWSEWRSSLSKRAMCERVRKFIPSLRSDMLVSRGLAGVRSSLIGKDGFVDEALILEDSSSLHVLNYNSPGATGAPVFSANLVRRLRQGGYLDGLHTKPSKAAVWSFDSTVIE